MTAFLTVIGLAFVTAGIDCGYVAYRRTLADYGGGRVWPWAYRMRVQGLAAARRFFRRRPLVIRDVSGAASLVGGAAGVVRVIHSGLPIPADASVEEQIRLLIRRVEHVEAEAAEDRTQHSEVIGQLRHECSARESALRMADEALNAKATAIAIGTVRLQIAGLTLVGFGTVVMALPTLLSL